VSAGDHDRENGDCGRDVAAYALGALTPDEARALEEHMKACAVCRDELAALQRATDVLPLSVPQLAMPRQLKRRVMADVRAHPRSSAEHHTQRRRAWLSGRPGLALAGAAAVAAAVAIGLLVASGSTSGTRVVQASVVPPGASAQLHVSRGAAALIVSRMPEPPAGKIYEVWLKRAGAAPAPTDALFGVTSSGSASVAVPGDLHGVTAVLVTPEPRGGSLAPTHEPVIVAQL
jgi:anti-sigma-K factor RskA